MVVPRSSAHLRRLRGAEDRAFGCRIDRLLSFSPLVAMFLEHLTTWSAALLQTCSNLAQIPGRLSAGVLIALSGGLLLRNMPAPGAGPGLALKARRSSGLPLPVGNRLDLALGAANGARRRRRERWGFAAAYHGLLAARK